MKKLLKKEWISQFIRFGLVGGSNALVSYITYVLVLFLLKGHMQENAALFLANFSDYVTGTLNSFVWNTLWVFKRKNNEERNLWIVLLKMFIMYAGTGIVLNYFLLILWINVLGISELIAPILNIAVGVPINFCVSKFWCFRSSKKKEAGE